MFLQFGVCDIHSPLSITSSSMLFYLSSWELPWNRIGYDVRIWLSNSQVASSRLRCFHCTFTYPTVRFQSKISLLSRIQSGSTNKSPGSTCTSFQFITWVTSCTYFFNTEIWKTLWTFILPVNLVGMSPIPFWTVFWKAHNIWVPT